MGTFKTQKKNLTCTACLLDHAVIIHWVQCYSLYPAIATLVITYFSMQLIFQATLTISLVNLCMQWLLTFPSKEIGYSHLSQPNFHQSLYNNCEVHNMQWWRFCLSLDTGHLLPSVKWQTESSPLHIVNLTVIILLLHCTCGIPNLHFAISRFGWNAINPRVTFIGIISIYSSGKDSVLSGQWRIFCKHVYFVSKAVIVHWTLDRSAIRLPSYYNLVLFLEKYISGCARTFCIKTGTTPCHDRGYSNDTFIAAFFISAAWSWCIVEPVCHLEVELLTNKA